MTTSEEKYKKLASEYAKLKAQIPVLKKAYIDEQTAHNELKEASKEKEQTLRKYEQEVDSLTFRNQQLSKRCQVLQDELEILESHKKKSKNKDSPSHAPTPRSPGIFNEELQSKIEENAKLHKQLHDVEVESKSKTEDLEKKLAQLEKQCEQHESVLNSTVQKSKTQIDKLQEEKAMLEVKLQTLESDIKSYKSRTAKAESQLFKVESELKQELAVASKIIADKLPFIDTKNKELNGLNLPTHDRRHQLRSKELVNHSALLLGEVTQALSNFYTYTEQRSQIYPADGKVEPISPVNAQYCKILHENMSHLRPVEQSLKDLLLSFKDDALTTLETATGLQTFAKHVKGMVTYMNKLLPYQLLSLEEECALSSCTSTLQAKNMDLHRALKRLNGVFNNLEEECAVSSCTSTLQAKNMDLHRALKRLNGVFNNLEEEFAVSSCTSSLQAKNMDLHRALKRLNGVFNNLEEECAVSSCTSTLQAKNMDLHRALKRLNGVFNNLEEECAVSSCTSTLQAKNMDLHRALKRLNGVFNKLDTITSVLAAQSTKTCRHSPSNHPKMFTILCTDLIDLHDTVREVSKHYNSKVSLEHQMPTATQRLKTTDECVVSSLVSLVTSTGKLSTFLSGNKEFFSQRAGYRTRGSSVVMDPDVQTVRSNPAIVQFRQKASKYISSLSQPCGESVPHHVAVQNRKTLLSSAESREGLAKQIEVFQQKVTKLEQDKEHWMLELQLLKIKYDNEIEKTKKLEKQLESSTPNHQVTSIADNIQTPQPQNIPRKGTDSDKRLDTSMLGKVEVASKQSSDSDTREMLIKNHFNTRINDLTLQIQLADSKSVSFHAEVRALHKQLQIAERAKKQAEDEQKALSQSYAQLKDELSTTSKNYESQLSMMSEHLAGMNEKLTQQKDEIDELRSHTEKHKSSSTASKFGLKKSKK